MSKGKSLAEQIEDAKTQIKQEQNWVKELIQKKNIQDRKLRTRRLIERGAMLESVIVGADTLSNDQIMSLLHKAFVTNSNANTIPDNNTRSAEIPG
jgi:predicted DNA-binding helix-hairpin-helix protein